MRGLPMRPVVVVSWAALCALAFGATLFSAEWQPAKGPLMTRWSRDVKPDKVHPEYPRPQLVRKQWVNLNGLWQYALAPKEQGKPAEFDGEILVPFPVESALSGVMKQVDEKTRLWYRRTFTAPAAKPGQHTLLNFGAVDWEATVWINGQQVAQHRGGYDPFSCDITASLKPQRGQEIAEQEIIVAVWDPTDTGTQPHGKQMQKPGGIFYTPTTGIWQTVWLELVPETYIASLKITPDVDQSEVRIEPKLIGKTGNEKIWARVFQGKREVAFAEAKASDPKLVLKIDKPRLWSPDDPFLYWLKIGIGNSDGKTPEAAAAPVVEDQVDSYFGLRKIALGKDAQGITRMMLNGKPLFQWAARSRLLARRTLHRAHRRGPSIRHRNHAPHGLQHGPQACEGRARPLVLLVRQAGPARLAGHAQRRQGHQRRRTLTSSVLPESAAQYRARTASHDRHAREPSVDRDVGAVQRRLGPIRHRADHRLDPKI